MVIVTQMNSIISRTVFLQDSSDIGQGKLPRVAGAMGGESQVLHCERGGFLVEHKKEFKHTPELESKESLLEHGHLSEAESESKRDSEGQRQ